MPHNIRVLCLSNDVDIIREMQSINAEDAGIRHMLPKARHYLVKLEAVRRPIVHILKETFLSNGGDATVSRDMITAASDKSDVLLSGTRKQFQRSLLALREQGFGCNKLAAEIEAAIRHFDSTPNLPNSHSITDLRISSMFGQIGARTLVMGILNVTPDSFSDGGKFADYNAAVAHAREMVEDGADIIDIGGESTRPGSDAVSANEEIDRIVPVIQELAGSVNVPISVDTTKAEVARAALDSGALIINDVSAATLDPDMRFVIAEKRCPAILQHIKGTPKDMQDNAHYDDLMGEICDFLRKRIDAVVDAGADERMLIIDPGFGFAKTVAHNLELLQRLRELKSIGRPIMVGVSRKATIGRVLGGLPTEERMEGTAAAVAISIANGADIVRVHDVREMVRVARMSDAIIRRKQA